MGTRADFYVGAGKDAEWIGSVAFDGYKWDEQPDCAIMQAKTAEDFRAAVAGGFKGRDDASTPEDGWPWPWATSSTTDYAYCFEDGATKSYCFGRPIERDESGDTVDTPDRGDWPDMKDKQQVTFGKRSGLIVLQG